MVEFLSGCGGARRELRPDDPVTLGPSEGVLALAVASEDEVANVTFCRDGDLLRCVSIGPFHTGDALRVTRMDAGSYCLMALTIHPDTGSSLSLDLAPGEGPCVVVEAGTVSYPGHLAIETILAESAAAMRTRYRFQARADEVRLAVEAQYPHLSDYPFRSTVTTVAR